MILEWMVYALVVALLLGVAAASLERVVGQRGWPVRWLWVGALAGSALLPAIAAALSALRRAELIAPVAAQAGEPTGVRSSLFFDPLASVPATTLDLDGWLKALWIGGALLVSVALAVSYLGLRRREARWSRRTLDGHEVWVAPDTGPAVVGFLRGRIVLPEWIVERGETERSMVLAHEAEHLRAGDPRLVLGALLLAATCPWNLALWWQGRRLRHAIEVDCDARVLGRGVDPRLYSRLLVDVTERGSAHRLAVAALGESQSSLERRIRHMFTPRPRSWWLRAAGATALATACVLVACQADIPSGPSGGLPVASSEPSRVQGEVYELAVLNRQPMLSNASEIAGLMDRLYPNLLRSAGVGGTVVAQFVILPDGLVDPGSVKIVDSPREELSAATQVALRAFRFRPGQIAGQPVNVLIQMPVTWQPGSGSASGGRVDAIQRREEVPPAAPAPNAPDAPDPGPRTAAAGGELQDIAYELAVLSKLPSMVNQAEIAGLMETTYPPLLQNAGIGGTVVVQLVIQPDGSVDRASLRVLSSTRQELTDPTTVVARRFRFSPGEYQGRPVRVLIQMPVTWQPKE